MRPVSLIWQWALWASGLGLLLVAPQILFGTRRVQFITLAARHAVPTMYHQREYVEAGAPGLRWNVIARVNCSSLSAIGGMADSASPLFKMMVAI
jgi:hypothetical protein